MADGGAMAQHFVDLVAKWTTIVNEVGEDPDKLAERANADDLVERGLGDSMASRRPQAA